MSIKQLPEIELIVEDDDNFDEGVKLISVVRDPAIDIKGMFFSNDLDFTFKKIKEQQMIVGPFAVPFKRIFRKDSEGDNGYFVYFSPQSIRNMAAKFNKNNNNLSINDEHTSRMVKGYIFSSWIVSDPVYDKSKFYGFNLQPGTWFGEVKIDDKEYWNNEVKEGKYSFSIEGTMKKIKYNMKEYTLQNFRDERLIDSLSEIELVELSKQLLEELI